MNARIPIISNYSRLIGLSIFAAALSSCVSYSHKSVHEKIIWENYDVVSCEDQATLSIIALNDKDAAVRSIAVDKLNLQSPLSNVALNDQDISVRKQAIQKLDLQSALSTIALNDYDAGVRLMAVKKLNLQSTLSAVATGDQDAEVRQCALKRLK